MNLNMIFNNMKSNKVLLYLHINRVQRGKIVYLNKNASTINWINELFADRRVFDILHFHYILSSIDYSFFRQILSSLLFIAFVLPLIDRTVLIDDFYGHRIPLWRFSRVFHDGGSISGVDTESMRETFFWEVISRFVITLQGYFEW